MSASLQRLSFVVSLLDNVTGPVGKIQKALNNTAESAKSAFADIGAGALGVVGAGMALQNLLAPAVELDKSLRRLADNASPAAVEKLTAAALDLSVQYGQSANEIVDASTKINSAISGLSSDELTAFTKASSVLASNTQGTMEETSLYISQMYERYKGVADKMGRAKWAEQLVGQTAYLRKELGANATDIADAMQGLNNLGSGLGVGMTEQMAVVATLARSTGISDAEQQYTAFLEYAVSAQEKLGMSFMDSAGNLLPMTQILSMIQGQFGDLSGADTWAILDDAFGDGSKLLQQLSKDTDGLAKTMDDLGKINGMDEAAKAAAGMVSPWDKLAQGINAVKIGFGTALLPVINPIVDSMSKGAQQITRWTNLFPELTKWIGIGVTTVIAMTAALGLLAMASGIAKVAMIGWGIATAAANGIAAAFSATMKALRAVMLAVNIVMFANPIGLIVAGIALLIAAVGACIYWWDDLKAAFLDTAWGQGLMSLIGNLMDWFKNLQGIAGEAVGWVVDKLNMIPGVNIGTDSTNADVGTVNRDMKTASVAPGGVTSHISKTMSNSSNRNNNVTINTTQAPTSHLMDSWMTMEAF